MKVALVGGTGFVGSYMVEALLERGHVPRLLVREGNEEKVVEPDRCEVVRGATEDEEALRALVQGCDAAIHLIGILREFPAKGITFEATQYESPVRLMKVCEEAGVKRFLLMSANGVREDGTSYQQTKYRAEQALRDTSLDWTVFRPSVLFGDPRGRMEFATQLYKDIVAPPMPVPLFHEGLLPFGGGAMQMSPIHVKDVATIFADVLEDPKSIGQTWCLGGPEAISWKEILRTVARATRHKGFGLPVPAWAVKLVAGWFDHLEEFPITRDQIVMLMEGNTCDSSDLFRRYGISPIPFEESQLTYLLASSDKKASE
jgi:NADH dehydrogenase